MRAEVFESAGGKKSEKNKQTNKQTWPKSLQKVRDGVESDVLWICRVMRMWWQFYQCCLGWTFMTYWPGAKVPWYFGNMLFLVSWWLKRDDSYCIKWEIISWTVASQMFWILNILHKQQQVLAIYISISFAVLDHTFSSLAMYSQTALALCFDWAIPPTENVLL